MIESLPGLVRSAAAERGQSNAIIFGDRVLSFRELDDRSSRLAQGLLREGVRAGDRIAYLDKNTPEFFVLLFGVAKLGAVTVGVNWRLQPDEIEHILRDAEAKVIVVGEEYEKTITTIKDRLCDLRRIISLGHSRDYETFDSFIDPHPADDPGGDAGPEGVVAQMYTSGTTGLPKGAMLTNNNMVATLRDESEELYFTPDSVNLVELPLFHIGGAGWGLMGLYNRCLTVLLREVDTVEILRALDSHKVTHALFVPVVLKMLLDRPELAGTDLSSMELIIYGASPIPQDVLSRALDAFDCKFVGAYGLTETAGQVTTLGHEEHRLDSSFPKRIESVGTAVAGAELRVVDVETGENLPVGQVGEVWVRSRQVMKGYWKKPEETERAIVDGGWLRTGDAGYLDADGFLFITDRIKDVIISGGENVYPAEVENALMSHPGIADVAVIGVPDETWGETVRAIVVRAADADLTDQDVTEYGRDRIAHYKCPTSVRWVEELPRNPSGKILKKELRVRFASPD